MKILINKFTTPTARGAYVKWAWAARQVSITSFDYSEGVEGGVVFYYLYLKADDEMILKDLKRKLHIPSPG